MDEKLIYDINREVGELKKTLELNLDRREGQFETINKKLDHINGLRQDVCSLQTDVKWLEWGFRGICGIIIGFFSYVIGMK